MKWAGRCLHPLSQWTPTDPSLPSRYDFFMVSIPRPSLKAKRQNSCLISALWAPAALPREQPLGESTWHPLLHRLLCILSSSVLPWYPPAHLASPSCFPLMTHKEANPSSKARSQSWIWQVSDLERLQACVLSTQHGPSGWYCLEELIQDILRTAELVPCDQECAHLWMPWPVNQEKQGQALCLQPLTLLWRSRVWWEIS